MDKRTRDKPLNNVDTHINLVFDILVNCGNLDIRKAQSSVIGKAIGLMKAAAVDSNSQRDDP